MTQEELRDLILLPETHRAILGLYHGAYTLGVTYDPRTQEHCFLLRVEGDGRQIKPWFVANTGKTVQILIEPNFEPPTKISK